MQVQIKFVANGCCTLVGNFASGDVARVPAELARHLVEDAGCARYIEQPVQQQAEPRQVRKTKTRKPETES